MSRDGRWLSRGNGNHQQDISTGGLMVPICGNVAWDLGYGCAEEGYPNQRELKASLRETIDDAANEADTNWLPRRIPLSSVRA